MPLADLYAYLLERKLVTQYFTGLKKAPQRLVLIHPRSLNTILGSKGIPLNNVTI